MDKTLELNYLPHLPTAKTARILDFGCGEGRVLSFLQSQGYTNYCGIDIDQEALQRLSPPLQSKAEHLTDLNHYVEKHREHFDLIILKDVLYYFTRDTAVKNLELILRSLRPGGKIIVEVFNGAQLTAPYTAAKDLGIQTIYTERSLQQILIVCNLKDITIFEQKAPNHGLKSALYRMVQRIYFAFVKAIFILERGVDSNNPKFLGKSLIGIAQKK